jgi:hypothetical protein
MSGQVAGQGGPPALQREVAVWLDGAPGRVGLPSTPMRSGNAPGENARRDSRGATGR